MHGISAPSTNMMSYTNGQTIAGMAMVGVGADGKIKVDTLNAVDIIIDIQGWTATTASDDQSDFVSRAPARLLDTRTTGGIINAGATRTVQVTGNLSIPVGATAVSVNLTTVDGSGAGAVAAYPNDIAFPGVSNVNFNNSSAIANAAIVKLSSDGKLKLQAIAANTHVVIDVTGWYQPATDTWTYAYDGDGTRQSKTGRPTRINLTGTTQFTWSKVGSLPQLLVEKKTATTGNADTIWYIYGPDGSPVEQISQVNGVTTTSFLHHDQLGSIRMATSTAGVVTGSWAYDPYGNVSNGTQTTNVGYAGQYRDAETGFYYMRARLYDPNSGQFLTRDPINGATRSAYGYVLGNPLNTIDPTGLWGWDELKQGIADTAGGVLNGITLGHGDGVLDAVGKLNGGRTSSNQVNHESLLYKGGTAVGVALDAPLAIPMGSFSSGAVISTGTIHGAVGAYSTFMGGYELYQAKQLCDQRGMPGAPADVQEDCTRSLITGFLQTAGGGLTGFFGATVGGLGSLAAGLYSGCTQENE